MLAPAADALGCAAEAADARTILRRGSSADEQVHVYAEPSRAAEPTQALKKVVDWLNRTTVERAADVIGLSA